MSVFAILVLYLCDFVDVLFVQVRSDELSVVTKSLKDYATDHNVRLRFVDQLPSSSRLADNVGTAIFSQKSPKSALFLNEFRFGLRPNHFKSAVSQPTPRLRAGRMETIVRYSTKPLSAMIDLMSKLFATNWIPHTRSMETPTDVLSKMITQKRIIPVSVFHPKPYPLSHKERWLGYGTESAAMKSIPYEYETVGLRSVAIPAAFMEKQIPFILQKNVKLPAYIGPDRMFPLQAEKLYRIRDGKSMQYPVKKPPSLQWYSTEKGVGLPYPAPVTVRAPVPIPAAVPIFKFDPVFVPVREYPAENTVWPNSALNLSSIADLKESSLIIECANLLSATSEQFNDAQDVSTERVRQINPSGDINHFVRSSPPPVSQNQQPEGIKTDSEFAASDKTENLKEPSSLVPSPSS